MDVKLHRKGEERPYCYIQCKAWGSEKVKLTTMREFLGVMAADKIGEGIFATTSDFHPEARAFAESNGIKPIVAADFLRLFHELPKAVQNRISRQVTRGDYMTPSCPSCDVKLVLRESSAKESAFWGCRNYPRCRTVIRLRTVGWTT